MRRGDHTPWVRNTSECGPAVPSGHRGVVAAAAVRVQPRVTLSSPHAGVGGRDPARGGDSGLSEPESHRPPLPPASFTKTPPRLPERDIVSPARPRWHRTGSSHTHPPPPTLAARPGVPKQPLALWLRHRRPQEASPGLQPRLVSTPRLRKEFQWEKEEQNLGQAGKGDETARVPGTRLSCEPRGKGEKNGMGEGKLREGRGRLRPQAPGTPCRDPGRRVPARPQGRTSHPTPLLGPRGGEGGGRTPQTPSPRGLGAHPVPRPTRSTALCSSNPTASTPHSWGSLGSCCAPEVPCQGGWGREKSAYRFFGSPSRFPPWCDCSFLSQDNKKRHFGQAVPRMLAGVGGVPLPPTRDCRIHHPSGISWGAAASPPTPPGPGMPRESRGGYRM